MQQSAAAAGPGSRWLELLRRLGWRHQGFRATSSSRALLALCLLLAIPFAMDQWAFQVRMRDYNPDLRGWLDNARELVAGPDAGFYRAHPFYIYPPFFLTLIWPLTRLSDPAAGAVFETVKWVALVVSLRAAWRLCSPPSEDVPPLVAVGSLVLTWRFIDNDLGVGNINVFLLCAVLVGCWWVARGRSIAGGALIALAVSIKVTPLLLLVYFAYKGRWRVLVGGLLAGIVCLVVWPAVCFGWQANWALLQAWYQAVVAGFLSHGVVPSEHNNQALVGILNRLLGPEVAIRPGTYLTIVELPPAARDAVRILLAASILLVTGWACRRRLEPRTPRLAFAAELSIVLIAMLLLSGMSWKAHFVSMVLPYSVLLTYLADARYPAERRRTIGVLLLASIALCMLTCDIITPRGANYAEALGLVTLGAVFAAGALLALRGSLQSALLRLPCVPVSAGRP
jgi:hypothetical protein